MPRNTNWKPPIPASHIFSARLCPRVRKAQTLIIDHDHSPRILTGEPYRVERGRILTPITIDQTDNALNLRTLSSAGTVGLLFPLDAARVAYSASLLPTIHSRAGTHLNLTLGFFLFRLAV
jgi:hypothetical protein